MKQTFNSYFRRLAGVLGAGLVVVGCSGSGEDVRVSFCKDMVATHLGASRAIQWQESRSEVHDHQYAEIMLRFDAGDGGTHQAACLYGFDAPDDNALTLADPLSGYATVPYRMTLDAEPLSEAALDKLVGRTAAHQGAETLRRAADKLEEAAR